MYRPFSACLVDELGDSKGLQGVQESQLVQACVRPHWTWMRKRQKHKSEKKNNVQTKQQNSNYQTNQKQTDHALIHVHNRHKQNLELPAL